MQHVAKVLILGADSVGKTLLLYRLKLNENVATLPSIGFNVEDINYKDKIIRMWDIGGGDKIKYLWKNYMDNCGCIIHVINISDKSRFDYYIECLNVMLDQSKNNRNTPIIIFGNKFNDKIEFEPEEILEKVNFPPEISPIIIKGNVKSGEGLTDILDYIYNNIEFDEEKIEEQEQPNLSEQENAEKNSKTETKPENKLVMLGLDGTGKTKILYLLKMGTKVLTIPTIGFNVETIENENKEKNTTIWDVGGNEKIRPLWGHYLKDIQGLIWVYDISKKETYEESQNELISILNSSDINNYTPLLIFANKSDLNKAGNNVEDFLYGIKDYLNNRPYFIKECNMDNLDSYKEGLDWICNNIN